jgi:hypothetical protein
MIDRREMMKLMVVGAVGAMVAGAVATGQFGSAGEPMRFSIEGDMGAVRATANGESVLVSGDFADRARFTIG